MMAVSRFHDSRTAAMHAAITDTQDKAARKMKAARLWVPMAIVDEPAFTAAVNLERYSKPWFSRKSYT